MFKTILLFLGILIIGSLCAQETGFRMSISTGGYAPEYPNYDYNSPLYGVDVQMDLINLYENYGFGAECFLSYKSYHEFFKDMNTYEFYLHNISGLLAKDTKFAYGVFAGARRTELNYQERNEEYSIDLMFTRFVVGFKYLSYNWGGILRWTQNEKHRSKLEYEIKLNNNIGWIIQFGGSLQGPVKGVKSDIHLMAGYEFYL